MKSFIVIAIVLTIFQSCKDKSSSNTNENDASHQSESNGAIIIDSVVLEENEIAIGIKTYESSEYESLGDELYNLEAIGGIQIGQELNDVIMILGKPDSVSQEEFWGVDGGFHSYSYYTELGLVIEFMRMEDLSGNFVQVIELNGNGVSTSKEITIGSDLGNVKNAYSREMEFEGAYFSDTIIGFGEGTSVELRFKIKDQKVQQIYLGPTVRC